MKSLIILIEILLLVCFVRAKDRCEPDFATDCFSAVQKDLTKVMDSRGLETNFTSDAYLENLCNAIDDAINCTSDVIDVDCSEAEGRVKFDKWKDALIHTYFDLCDSEGEDDKLFLRGLSPKLKRFYKNLFKALVVNLNCWNATHFLECLQTNAGISTISQMMATDSNKKECNILYQSFELCRVKQLEVTKDYCTQNQTMEAVLIVHRLFDTFMEFSDCRQYYGGIAGIAGKAVNGYQINQNHCIHAIVSLVLLYFSIYLQLN